MIAAIVPAAWRAFLRLFGLNACPAPRTAERLETPAARTTRERIGRLLRNP